jgi:hypothetical protein
VVNPMWCVLAALGGSLCTFLIALMFLQRAWRSAKEHGDKMYDLGVRHGAEKQAFVEIRADMKRLLERKLRTALEEVRDRRKPN